MGEEVQVVLTPEDPVVTAKKEHPLLNKAKKAYLDQTGYQQDENGNYLYNGLKVTAWGGDPNKSGWDNLFSALSGLKNKDKQQTNTQLSSRQQSQYILTPEQYQEYQEYKQTPEYAAYQKRKSNGGESSGTATELVNIAATLTAVGTATAVGVGDKTKEGKPNPNSQVPLSAKKGGFILKHDIGGMLGNIGGMMGGAKSGASGGGGMMGAIGGMMGGMSNTGTLGNNATAMMGQTPQEQGKYGNITSGMNGAYDQIQSMVSNLGPYGKLISGAMGVNKALGNAVSHIGGGTDGMTKSDAVLGSAFFQMTPLGLINGFGGSKSHTLNDLQDQTDLLYGSNTTSGFGGTLDAVGKTMQYSNKKYGLFSNKARKRANRAIDLLNTQQNQIQDIASASKDAFDLQSSMASVNENATAFNLEGGYQQGAVHVGKSGMKIDSTAKGVGNNTFKYSFLKEVQEFKEGGQMNVIPEGNLHARLHHMEDASDLTKKGIPVVDNDGQQQAEIELNEIIFNKETTTKLEDLWKKYKETKDDTLAIKAGMILTCEIMTNTDDRTGLINTI